MKGIIYFFKHNNIDAIKIGRTSNETVNDRFQSFKTYSPFGAEILGFYETLDCVKEEKRLHNKYKDFRISGEFFKISKESVINECENNNTDFYKINSMILELINDGILLTEIKERILLFKNKKDEEKTTPIFNVFKSMSNTFTSKEFCNAANNIDINNINARMFLHRNIDKFFIKTNRGVYQKI